MPAANVHVEDVDLQGTEKTGGKNTFFGLFARPGVQRPTYQIIEIPLICVFFTTTRRDWG
jgi:hypothetical protein